MAATAKLLILLCLSGTALSFLPPFALFSLMKGGGEMSKKLPLLIIMMKHPHIMQSPIGMMLMRVFTRAEFSNYLPMLAYRFDFIIKLLQQNPMLMFMLMRNPDMAGKMLMTMSFMGGPGANGGIDPMAMMMMTNNGGEMSQNPMLAMSMMSRMAQGQGAAAGEPGAAGGGMPGMDPMMLSVMANGDMNPAMLAAMSMTQGGTGAAPMGMGSMGGGSPSGAPTI